MAKFILFSLLFFSLTLYVYAQTEEEVKPRVYTSIERGLQEPDQVVILKLEKKRIKKFPEEIYQFKNLEQLILSRNKLKVIPPEIEKLSKLKVLDLSKNKIKKLPKEIGRLHNLQKLIINRNPIDSLPEEIGMLTNLEHLDMWSTELAILPDSIKQLEKLKVVELRGILFNQDQQDYMHSLLPEATIYFSPPCNCKF